MILYPLSAGEFQFGKAEAYPTNPENQLQRPAFMAIIFGLFPVTPNQYWQEYC